MTPPRRYGGLALAVVAVAAARRGSSTWAQPCVPRATVRSARIPRGFEGGWRQRSGTAHLVTGALGLGLGAAALRPRAARFKRSWGRGSDAFPVVGRRAAATLVSDQVRAPPSDPKSYRVVHLQNGLQVLLASQPAAETSAAALAVRCGTFQDPEDRLGLAHFHEHMLFLGTEKYPKEDEYSRYLSDHGGDSNAFTMSEYTTYYFKVSSDYFDGALDRFAQFFVCPTFDPNKVESEMKVVDSESTNYSTDDGWRLLQVLKASAAEQHPFFRFDVGNVDTLGATDLAGTRSRLVDWNRTHYQAGSMQLVVVGQDSLEDLERSVEEKFGPVRSGPGSKEQTYPSSPWPSSQLGRVISCVPIKEVRSISACWPLPPATKYLFAKPELYIAHLLGHEGEGSLHDLLNQLGWVDSLSAGSSQSFSDEQLLAINVGLTPEGDAHRDEVLALIFDYVELIRSAGPKDEIFKELALLQEIGFAHKEESPTPDDFAASAAMALHKYPPEEVLRGPYALDEWRADIVSEYFSTLTPERCLVFQTSDAFKEPSLSGDAAEKGWKTEKWYKAAFKEEPLTQEMIAEWKASLEKTLGGQSFLRLPEPNCFVPEDFTLCAPDGEGAEMSKFPLEVLPPLPVINDGMLRAWHKTDRAFKTPREYVLGQIHTDTYQRGPEAVAMMRLFCSVVQDDLNTFSYDATMAGLGYGFEFSDNLSISFGGFNNKLFDLAKVVVDRVGKVLVDAETAAAAQAAGDEALDAMDDRGQELLEKLEVQRQLLLQDYNNFVREDPWSVGNYYLSQLMLRNSWHLSEYIEVLENPPDLAKLSSSVRQALSQAQLDILVHGNVTADDSKSMATMVCDGFKQLGATPLPELRRKEVTKLPLGTTIFEYDLVAENPAQENCSTHNIYQVGPSNEDLHRDACVALACHIAHVSAFQRLRTEQQLGYIVQAFAWREHHVSGFSILVQGAREAPPEVDRLMEEWLASFEQELEDMSEEDFQNNVQGVLTQTTKKWSRMAQETGHHWNEIFPRRYDFKRYGQAVKAIEGLKKEDVLALFREYLFADAPQRRKMSVRVLGTSAKDVRSQPEGPTCALLTGLEELREFQAGCEFWPAPPPSEMPAVKESA